MGPYHKLRRGAAPGETVNQVLMMTRRGDCLLALVSLLVGHLTTPPLGVDLPINACRACNNSARYRAKSFRPINFMAFPVGCSRKHNPRDQVSRYDAPSIQVQFVSSNCYNRYMCWYGSKLWFATGRPRFKGRDKCIELSKRACLQQLRFPLCHNRTSALQSRFKQNLRI